MVAGNRHNHKNEIYLRISHDVCTASVDEREGRCATLQQMQQQQEWFHCSLSWRAATATVTVAVAVAEVEAGRQRSARCR